MVDVGDNLIEVAVIGGSGFECILEKPRQVSPPTPFGEPSSPITIGMVGGRRVGFVKRHGEGHTLPPGAINYRANLWALHHLGARRVLATSASGSLRPEIGPGDLVLCDQFVDRTRSRPDTYVDEGSVAHVSAADPYCSQLRQLAWTRAQAAAWDVHETGTVVVIEGPRFSSRAESAWFAQMGWDLVNMTQYPEVILARELEMCYAALALVTDYDAGVADRPEIAPVTAAEAMRVFRSSNARLLDLVVELVAGLPAERTCECATAMRHAAING